MLERTLVLVDTSYLLASFYNSWEEGARGQLEISLATVVHRLDQVAHGLVDQPVQRQNWYDGIPDSGPHRYQRTLRVIEGVQLRAGQLIEWGDRRTQKAVDTLLVADMIQAAYKGHCSDMVLVTGDADMIPGVQVAVEAGVRMHLVGFGWDSISSALRHACDTTTVLDPRTDFHDAMRIRVLEGPIPPKVRTAPAGPQHPGEDARDPDVDESVGMVEVHLRSDRAAAISVAEEARQSVADEEAAAEAEELAADQQECTIIAQEGRPAAVGKPNHDDDSAPTRPQGANTGAPAPAATGSQAEEPAGGGAPKPGPVPRPAPSPGPIAPAHAQAQPPQKAQAAAATRPTPSAPGADASSAAAASPSAVGAPGDASAKAAAAAAAGSDRTRTDGTHTDGSSAEGAGTGGSGSEGTGSSDAQPNGASRPSPSMMAPHRRPLRSKFVPLPEEVWTTSGEQTPFDVGQQYATWWYEQAATEEQRDGAHLLSGGVLPPAIDRPLLQFACQMLNEFTLTESQRVRLRDGFHEGIRAVLLKHR